MQNRTEPWSHTAALIGTSLQQIGILATVWLWLAYVYHRLYEKKKENRTVRVIRATLIVFFMALIIVNLFSGVMFTITPDNRIGGKPLYYLSAVTELLLFLSSALTVWYYDRQQTKIRFLRVAPMIASVFLASIPSLFTRYGTLVMGFAIGMVLLDFSMISAQPL